MPSEQTKIVLLPGLDGTGDLLESFAEKAPDTLQPQIIRYPTDQVLSYDQLLEMIEEQLAGEDSFVILGESFSGPLAVRYACKHPEKVRGVIFCVSFVTTPVPRWFAAIARSLIFKLSAPSWVLKWLLAGRQPEAELLGVLKEVTKKLSPEVVSSRIQDVIEVDCRNELMACTQPILYMQANDDNLVRSRNLKTTLEVRGDIKVSAIDGPHLLLQTSPKESWRAIETFVESLT